MTKADYFKNSRIRFIDDRDAIARYVADHEKEDFQHVIDVAEGVVGQSFIFNLRWDMERTHEPVVFDEAIDWLHQPGDDSEWVFAFNRMRFWICLGQAYAHSGDERYARAFASQLEHWIEHVKRDDPAAADAWRSIEAGLRMEYWTKAMQYFYDSPSITDELLKRYLDSIADHAEFLYSVWGSYHLMSNWGVLENHGLFLASLALPESEMSERYTQEAIRRLALEIDIQVYDDGIQWEQSPMYHNEVLHCYLDVVLIARRLGMTLPSIITEKTHSMSLAALAWQKPDGTQPTMGDSDRIDQRDIITKGACLFADPQLKAGGYERLDFDSVWDLGYQAISVYDQIPVAKRLVGLHSLGESGNAFYHQDDLYVRFHCGTLGAGHGHSDKLHFDLFANGEDILIDPGRYTYVDKPERYEFKDSIAHNTTTVDNLNFTVCKDSWECSKLSAPIGFKAVEKSGFVALQGSHQGYLDRGVLPRRTITILNEELLLVSDVFIAQAEHDYQSHWHFNDSGQVTLTDDAIRFDSAQNSVELLTVSSHPLSHTIKDSRLSRRYNEVVDNKSVVIQTRHNGFASMHTVIGINKAGAFEALNVEKIPVTSNFKHVQFSDEMIEAVKIEHKQSSFMVVLAHQEWASPTDTFNAQGCIGFGTLVVFDLARGKKEIGTRLLC
jgi:hypothetical protein